MAVSSTWLVLTLGILTQVLNPEPWKMIVAMLMGGSVVGIAYQGEKAIGWAAQNPMIWKLLVLIPGFLVAYGAVQYMNFWTLGGAVIVLGTVAYLFFVHKTRHGTPKISHGDSREIKEIEKGLEKCC